MNILVAGGAGMIGSHLCEQLLMLEHRVICVDNLSTGRLENIRRWIWDDKWFNYSTDSQGAGLMQFFLSGRLGMLEMGPWELVNVVDKARFKWDVAPFPKGPAGHTTHQSVDGTFIWNGTNGTVRKASATRIRSASTTRPK